MNDKTHYKKSSSNVGVLDKMLSIIGVLQDNKHDLGLTEIANLSGVNKTSCYRILQTLISGELIETGEHRGTYRLGTRFIKLGGIVQKRISLRQKALPYLKELSNITGNTSYLTSLKSKKAVCIERIDSEYIQVLSLEVGDSWPLYQGAASRAILAYLESDEINEILSNPIQQLTSKTKTKKSEYWEMINIIRTKGYSVSYEDVTLGIASIGAPIFNHNGEIIGAISISSIVQRISLKKEQEIANHILQAAQNISRELGWNN